MFEKSSKGFLWLVALAMLLALPLHAQLAPEQEPLVGPPQGTNRVLDLGGSEGHLELPSDLLSDYQSATVEGWFKWRSFNSHSHLFNLMLGERDHLTANNFFGKPTLLVHRTHTTLSLPTPLEVDTWYHLAVVASPETLKIYVNGVLSATKEATERRPPPPRRGGDWDRRNTLGKSEIQRKFQDNEEFNGQMDEIRVWGGVRTSEEIAASYQDQLTGTEENLIGLWTFDDLKKPGRDFSKNAHHGTVVGNVQTVLSPPLSRNSFSIVEGTLVDQDGEPADGTRVRILRDGQIADETTANSAGEYSLSLIHDDQTYLIEAEKGEKLGITERLRLDEGVMLHNLQLRDSLSIGGTVRNAVGNPIPGVRVDILAAADGTPMTHCFSDAQGRFAFRLLPDDFYLVRAASLSGPVFAAEGEPVQVGAINVINDLELVLPEASPAPSPSRPNKTLKLSGDGYVELPPGTLREIDETTIEAWVKFDHFYGWQRFFSCGSSRRNLHLGIERGVNPNLQFGVMAEDGTPALPTAPGVLTAGKWCHVAVTIGPLETKLYFNGMLVAGPVATSFKGLPRQSPVYFGRWMKPNSGFVGEMDEIRIWSGARDEAEIRGTMFQRLSGSETGLIGLWNFDDPDNPAADATPNHLDGMMEGNAETATENLPTSTAGLDLWVQMSGVVTDADGRTLSSARVLLEKGEEKKFTDPSESGRYSILVRPTSDPWMLRAESGDLSAAPRQVVLDSVSVTENLQLRDSASISGHIQAPDESPLPTVVMQAVPLEDENPIREKPGLLGEVFVRFGLIGFPTIAENETPDRVIIYDQVDTPLERMSTTGVRDFYLRARGFIRITEPGIYTFYYAANNFGRLSIDGKKLIESRNPGRGRDGLDEIEMSASLHLEAGDHDLLVELVDQGGGRDGFRLRWAQPGSLPEVVPANVLFHRYDTPPVSTTITDARGRFRFSRLQSGRYQLRAHVPGDFADFDQGGVVNVEPDQPVTGLSYILQPFKQGRWRNYSHIDGLASDTALCVFQASDGSLWFGTNRGASRFDGRKFENLTTSDGLPDAEVRAITEGPEGVLWFGTSAGLVQYDTRPHPEDEEAHSDPTIQRFIRDGGIFENDITSLDVGPDGRIWGGSLGGLFFLDSDHKIRESIFKEPIMALLCDSAGHVWVGHADGVSRVEGQKMSHFSEKDGLARGTVISIHESRAGALWFGTEEAGVSRYQPAPQTGSENAPPSPAFTTYTVSDGLPHNRVKSISEDRDGNLWFAASPRLEETGASALSAGLAKYDGNSFINFGVPDGLLSQSIQDLLVDSRGGLWAPSMLGISHYDFQSILRYDERNGLEAGSIQDIASTSDGSVWFVVQSERGKLSRFDGKQFVKITRDDGLYGSNVLGLFVDNDNSLLVSDLLTPVSRLAPSAMDGTETPRFEVIEGSPIALGIARSPAGDLWLGEKESTYIQGGGGPTTSAINQKGKLLAPSADGTIWIGNEAGIWHYSPATALLPAQTDAYTTSQGLPSNDIRELRILNDGTLVAGTREGAASFDGKRFAPWPADLPALHNIPLFDVEQEPDGDLWLATFEGVFHTDGVSWSKIDVSDYLPQNQVNRVHRTSDGAVWIGTSEKGVARYQPHLGVPRSPEITVQTNRDDFTDLSHLPTVLTGQRVTFRFNVVDFYTAVSKRQYRWQIFEGERSQNELDAGWSSATTGTVVEQIFESPGDWTLAVQFIDRDLNYSEPSFAKLSVALPWHANTAIMVPAGLAAAGLLGWALVALMLYIRKKNEAEKLRERLLEEELKAREAAEEAKDAAEISNKAKSQFLANMSHELRTPLNAIIGYSEMVGEELDEIGAQELQPDIDKIVSAAKHQLGLVNDILDISKIEAGKMGLYLENFNLPALVEEVASTVQPLVTKNSNHLTIDCPADLGTMRADQTKVRQTLFNLLSNACKFTKEGLITLVVRREGDNVTFAVSDTGIGMTPEQLDKLFSAFTQADASTTRKFGGTGLGLAISQQFCQMMGGELAVTSTFGEGSTFTATIPLLVAKPRKTRRKKAERNNPLNPKTGQIILVVDVEGDRRDLTTRSLAKEGYLIESAADEKTALAKARELHPTAITLNVMTPDVDSWSLLNLFKKDPETSKIPVIMLTTNDDKEIGYALGAPDSFARPVNWHELAITLGRHQSHNENHKTVAAP